jgi:hypothetical protein
MNTLTHIKNANVPTRIKSCIDKKNLNMLLRHAIIETFKSGFLFDNTINILHKKTFPPKFSNKKKKIMMSAFPNECKLFSLFKLIVLSFQDYYLIDRCVNFRGDFIFATSSYYWKNQTLVKRAINSCHNAFYLLSDHALTYKYQTRENNYDLKSYVFNVRTHDKTKRYKQVEINLTHDDNKTLKSEFNDYSKTVNYSFYDANMKRIDEHYEHYFYDYFYDYYNNYYYDYYDHRKVCCNAYANNNRTLHIKIKRKTYSQRCQECNNEEFLNKYYFDERDNIHTKKYFFSHDETNFHSKKIKNNKEVNAKKWSSRKKITKYYHEQNKHSKKSRKIISTYKSACV